MWLPEKGVGVLSNFAGETQTTSFRLSCQGRTVKMSWESKVMDFDTLR